MITMRAELTTNLDSRDALCEALQTAIELEHATIPAYLYALYSIVPGKNTQIGALLRSVVLEEMTHMGLACNLLNAVGGAPEIDKPGFVPTYPGPLPGSVETGLTVPLAPLSLQLVADVFMAIEQPEDPLQFRSLRRADTDLVTIGEFYAAIADQLKLAGPEVFSGDPDRQVTHDLGDEKLIAITNLSTALQAIETIVEEGEGTRQSPLDREGELAHYYRFGEVKHGRQLVPNPGAPPDGPPEDRYSYTGPPIPFEAAGVRPLITNPSQSPYPAGSVAAIMNSNFNYTYTALLKNLHATFNGQPECLMSAVGLMESCKQLAMEMGQLPADPTQPTGSRVGPSFDWQPVNPRISA